MSKKDGELQQLEDKIKMDVILQVSCIFSMKFITALIAIFFMFSVGNLYAGEVSNASRPTIISDSKKTTIKNLPESAQYDRLNEKVERILKEVEAERKVLEQQQITFANQLQIDGKNVAWFQTIVSIFGIFIAIVLSAAAYYSYTGVKSMKQDIKKELDENVENEVGKIVKITMEGTIEKPLLELTERVNALGNYIKDKEREKETGKEGLAKYPEEKETAESKIKDPFAE